MKNEQIEHLLKLSQIYLNETEKEVMKGQFDSLLGFVGKLQSINTDGVNKMYTPILSAKMDVDTNSNTNVDKKQLFENSPSEFEDNMIVIKSSTVEH